MSRPININETLTFAPTSNVSTTGLSASSSYPASNGYTDASSNTYVQFSLSNGTTGSTYYVFSVSGIPSGATISSVSCVARIRVNNTSRVTNTQIQLYSGTTAKGTSGTFASTSTSNTVTLDGGSWTIAELENARLYFKGTGSGNNSRYIYFYGATLSISYSLQGTEYEIISTLGTDAVSSIDPAGQTYVISGGDYELSVYIDSVDDIIVEDNGVDVTDQLVLTHPTGGSLTDTFIPSSFDYTNSIYDTTSGTNGVYDTNYIDNGLTDHNSSTRAAIYAVQGSNADTYIYYNFDCSSIPRNATITSVSCQVNAGNQGTNYYSSNYRQVQLCSGTTEKGSSQNITGTNTSPTTVTVNGGSSWTRAELDDIKIRYWVRRGTSNTTTGSTISFYGATLSVTYTVPAEDYYVYTLSNVSADHTIIISDAIIEIPEEDPQYNYYPITISSINATTEPERGTTRVVEGTNQTITIYPSDPLVTLVTDNGVNISSQLVSHGGTIPTPTVATLSGASYGFTLNNSTGYYVSANQGVDKSAAVCRVSFDFPVRCLVTINYINYAEATYDFGIFGNIDVALNNNYKPASGSMPDSDYKLACNTSSMNTSSVQTITYEIPSGEHYVDIKFSKDDATSSNNDTLQWKITNIEALEPNNYYTYTLSNIQEAHSLIFIFGDVVYYFVNADGTGAKLFPSGSMVQLPGDYYSLTIVPDDYSYSVTVTDNNTDVTSQVQRKEEEITKNGNTYTVVNYIYRLSNIQATHNIVVQASSNINNPFYIRVGNSWVKATKVYVRSGNQWSEVQDYDGILDLTQVYRKG
jgi:hypothetical protein